MAPASQTQIGSKAVALQAASCLPCGSFNTACCGTVCVGCMSRACSSNTSTKPLNMHQPQHTRQTHARWQPVRLFAGFHAAGQCRMFRVRASPCINGSIHRIRVQRRSLWHHSKSGSDSRARVWWEAHLRRAEFVMLSGLHFQHRADLTVGRVS